MGFEVFKGLPMPQGPKKKYNFEDLEVGDMLFVPIGEEDHNTVQNRITSAASSWGKRRNIKFASQIIQKNDNGELGVGVWRVE
jgi:hypothetical protein